MKTILGIFVVLAVFATFQMVYFYPVLPDTVASHFGAGGRPDGWSSKTAFFTIFAAALAMTVVLFLALPLAILRLPASWINLPKKDYWLAPERARATREWLSRRLLWFGSATLAFLVFTLQATVRANLADPHRLGDGFLVVLIAYMAFVAVVVVGLVVKLRNPPSP